MNTTNELNYFYEYTSGEFLESRQVGYDHWNKEIDYPNTTKTPPLEIKEGFVSVWSRDTSTWSYMEDHRGKEGYIYGVWTKIKDIGALPEGWTDEPPPPPPLILEEKQANMRRERDSILSACDFTQMPDNPLSDAEKEAWRMYRQALRDLTEDPLFATEPESVAFPEKP